MTDPGSLRVSDAQGVDERGLRLERAFEVLHEEAVPLGDHHLHHGCHQLREAAGLHLDGSRESGTSSDRLDLVGDHRLQTGEVGPVDDARAGLDLKRALQA